MLRHSKIKDIPLTLQQFIHKQQKLRAKASLLRGLGGGIRTCGGTTVHRCGYWPSTCLLWSKFERLREAQQCQIPAEEKRRRVSWVFFKSWLTQCTSNEAECQHNGLLKPQKCCGNWQQRCRAPPHRQRRAGAEQKAFCWSSELKTEHKMLPAQAGNLG